MSAKGTFKPTKAVKGGNRKLADKNEKVLSGIRTIDAAPHWMKDKGEHQTFPAPYVDQTLQSQADRYQVKQQLAKQAGNLDEGAWYTQVPLTEEDVSFVMKQSELEELMMYDEQFLQLVDVSNASELERFKNIYPAFFEKRKEYAHKIVKMQVALAKIALMGIQSKDDLDLVINIQALPDGGKQLMELLSIPVHYLVLANTSEFLHTGDEYRHAPETGAPKPFGIRAPYKNRKGNLEKIGAGYYPSPNRDADSTRYNIYGAPQTSTSRGQTEAGNKGGLPYFKHFLQSVKLQ